MTTRYQGGCLCGAVRFEVGALRELCFCHCTSCRRAAGAPTVPWGTAERAAFKVALGDLREVRSSASVWRGFCAVCGTSITYRHEEKPAEIDVALASLDDPEVVRPECHLWLEDKPSWVHISDGLPQYARSRAEGATAITRMQRPGYTAVTARIVHEDAAGLVAFIQQVFGAQGQYLPGVPAELRIGDTLLLVSEAFASGRARKSAFLYVYVSDIEITHRRALELGARELEAPLDTPYGDRRSMIEDVWGNTWQIARYVSSGAARA